MLAGTSLRDVAERISPRLAKAALAGLVDGVLVDLTFPLERDAAVRIVTDRKSRKRWRSTATARRTCWPPPSRKLFPGAQCGIGPATDEGFFYDFVVERPFVPEDLEAIERKMKRAGAAGPAVRASDVAARRGQGVLRRPRRAAEGAADRREDEGQPDGLLLHDQGPRHFRRFLRRPARAYDRKAARRSSC